MTIIAHNYAELVMIKLMCPENTCMCHSGIIMYMQCSISNYKCANGRSSVKLQTDTLIMYIIRQAHNSEMYNKNCAFSHELIHGVIILYQYNYNNHNVKLHSLLLTEQRCNCNSYRRFDFRNTGDSIFGGQRGIEERMQVFSCLTENMPFIIIFIRLIIFVHTVKSA